MLRSTSPDHPEAPRRGRDDVVSSDAPDPAPDVLTIPEVSRIMRISEPFAFKRAQLYRGTNGAEGIPNRREGRRILVLRAALEEYLGMAITSIPPPLDDSDPGPSDGDPIGPLVVIEGDS